MSNVPLPQPDAYEYLIANVWRSETHWNGVKASDHRCLYATEKMHAHAAAVSAAKDAEIAQLRQYLDTAQRRAAALGDEVAGLREDAERYRWLRDMARTVDWTQYIKDTAYVCHCRIGPQGMDAAIDAARKGEA